MDLTMRLKTLTAQHRLNPRLVSKAIKVPYSTVERWYKGEVFPRLDQAAALAELFGVSLDELAGRSAAPDPLEAKVLGAARDVTLAVALARIYKLSDPPAPATTVVLKPTGEATPVPVKPAPCGRRKPGSS